MILFFLHHQCLSCSYFILYYFYMKTLSIAYNLIPCYIPKKIHVLNRIT